MKGTRKVVLKRLTSCVHQYVLCDAETGQTIAAQVKTEIISVPDAPVKVVVTFVDHPGDDTFIIEK